MIKKQISLKQNQEYKKRIELIQGFEFPTACTRVRVSPDLDYIIATGVYMPTIKLFELRELSLKCLRGCDSEIIDFCYLDSDYKKLAFAQMDRNIEFHAAYGKHYKTRVPKMPRHIIYNQHACDLIVGCSGNEVYRMSLDEGKFLNPFVTDIPNVNKVLYNPSLDLVLVGGENGLVETWDYQNLRRLGTKRLNGGSEVTAMQLDPTSGFQYLIGSQDGMVKMYDLRYDGEVLSMQHRYKKPIKNIKFHNASRKIVSADFNMIKIYDKDSGALFTNIEPRNPINDIELFGDSGMILVASEGTRIGTYYIPALGPAPRWCSYIENITEELEQEQHVTVYDEFKFLSYEDLERLNCLKLLETKLVKSYMHGFLMKKKLYTQLKRANDPFDYQKYRKDQIKAKMDAKTKNRIRIVDQKPKRGINDEFKHEDDRFKAMFADPNFLVNKASDEYLRRHPSERPKRYKPKAVFEYIKPFEED